MKISIIVPCYNEEGNVYGIFDAIKNIFEKTEFDYEIVFINDGSKDKTFKLLKNIHNENIDKINIKVINFSRNFGKEAAIYAGIKESKGDYVSLIDADMQQDPQLILDMVNILEENEDYDCVAAFQKERHEGKVLTFFKNSFYKIIRRMTKLDFVNGASDFRTFRRSVADAITDMPEYHRFSKGIFAWVGFNTYYMEYEVRERMSGESKWSFFKLFSYALDGITAFTTAPLYVSSFVGFISAALSIIYLIVVVIQKLFFSIAVPGYATIVVLILFLGGLQLTALGIIGDYLAKLYIQSKDRPIYIAKEILDYEKDKQEHKKDD